MAVKVALAATVLVLGLLFIGCTFNVGDSNPLPFVAVTDIDGIQTSGYTGTAFSLSGARVSPSNATNKTIAWSVTSSSAAGVIPGAITGTSFTATGTGSVSLTATITNGQTTSANYTKEFMITISPPSPPGDEPLPSSVGANALSGKTYFTKVVGYDNLAKIVFSTTTEGAVSGTYTVYHPVYGDSGWILTGGKYTYIETETGNYAWNATTTTVSLKPEQVKSRNDKTWGAYLDKTAYRSAEEISMSGLTDAQIREMAGMSRSEFLDYVVTEAFGNKTRVYSFSGDNAALFLAQTFSVSNTGVNELSGNTFTFPNWGNNRKVVFNTTSTYTLTADGSPAVTGTYKYDGVKKWVYLTPTLADGQDRSAYYASLSGTGGEANLYPSAADYKAALTNEAFRADFRPYNPTAKTL